MATEENRTCGQRCAAFTNFLYNSSEGKILGRTPSSWGLIGLFYLVYYSLLAAFFVGMLSVLLYGLIEDERPRLTGDHSVLRMVPGLGMRPQPDITSTLIRYHVKDPLTAKPLIESVQKLYDEMQKSEGANCDLTDPQANRDFDPLKKYCKQNVSTWGPCQAKENFGYNSASPCVIIKMNRIYGWLPNLKNANMSHPILKCFGENTGDKDNVGTIEYYPSMTGNSSVGYFSSALFPYVNQKGYTTPTVAVRFKNIRKNMAVMIMCQLDNLEGVEVDRVERQAMVRFEVEVIDN